MSKLFLGFITLDAQTCKSVQNIYVSRHKIIVRYVRNVDVSSRDVKKIIANT